MVRFTENTKAARMLRDMFLTGQLTGDESPGEARMLNPEFQRFDAKAFGQKFRKYAELHRKGNLADTNVTAKRNLEARASEDVKPTVVHDAPAGGSGHELTLGQMSFHPLYTQADWIDSAENFANRLSVPIVLPSGIGNSDVTVSVVDNGNVLQVDVTWPSQLSSPTLMFKPWILDKNDPDYTSFHPEVIALEKTLKTLRTSLCQTRSEKLISTARIPLPFKVDERKISSHILIHNGEVESERTACQILIDLLFQVEEIDEDCPHAKRPKVIAVLSTE